MRCDDLAGELAAVAGDGQLRRRRARRHVASCLRCQAELAQYRRLARALAVLRTEVLVPPPGLVDDVLVLLEAAGERSALRALVRGHRAAWVGGGLALTAAAGAGALVLARRRPALAS